MTNPTFTIPDLLLLFEIPKPKAAQKPTPGQDSTVISTTSKPNLPKVQHVADMEFFKMMQVGSGMGTMLASALTLSDLVTAFILSMVDEDQVEAARKVIVDHLELVKQRAAGKTKAAGEAEIKQLQERIKGYFTPKVKQGAFGEADQAPEGEQTSEGAADAEQQLADALTDVLNGSKKKQVH